jgi:hypothetical protein
MILQFPHAKERWPIELYRAEFAEIYNTATDTFDALPVHAVIPQLDDGAVEVGPYRLTPDVALALSAALKLAARYATPVSYGPHFSQTYTSDPDGAA